MKTHHVAEGSAGKKSLKEKALEEMKVYLLTTLYLWVLLALFAEYKRALLQENGINLWNQTYAIVNAMIFAKVVMLGEVLKLGKRLQKQALIWLVLGKSLMFSILLIVFHIGEESIRAWFEHQPLLGSIQNFGGGTWRGMLIYGALLFVTLVPLFAVKEIQRVMGRDLFWELLFTRERSGWRGGEGGQ